MGFLKNLKKAAVVLLSFVLLVLSIEVLSSEDSVEIYKGAQVYQCQPGSGISPEAMAAELRNKGIEIIGSGHREPHPCFTSAVCDRLNGDVNVYKISKKDQKKAVDLGFRLWSELLKECLE